MSTAVPPSAPAETEAARGILEDFVVDNTELEQLEQKLRRFNLFEALKLVWHEVRHSDFLAYLLDPECNHGMGDRFLKMILQCALKGNPNQTVTPIDIDVWNLASAEVRREWQNIDIFVRDEANRLAVIIENKVESEEHSNQLARYYECVAQECKDWKIVPIFLTKEGESPSDDRFIALGYDQVCGAIERLLELNGRALDSGVRTVIEHYAEMLRRYIVAESEISDLCRRIYSKHKQALDLIYEHRPDRQQLVRERLQEWVKQKPDVELDHCTKAFVRFIPKELDSDVFKQGSGWTPTGRMLLFEFTNTENDLIVKFIIGPGPTETRQKLFDLAHANKPLFKPFAKIYQQWNTVYTHRLLNAKSYELPEDDFIEELHKQFSHFFEKDYVALVNVVKGAMDKVTA